MNPITYIRFGCSIRLPSKGRFICVDDYLRDPQLFLTRWVTGAVGTIYSGPLRNVEDEHDGRLLIVPKVEVRWNAGQNLCV